jgi:hypothetical protein
MTSGVVLGLLAAASGAPIAPTANDAKRWYYEQSILNCSSVHGGFGTTGDVIISVRRAAQSAAQSIRGGGGLSAGATYAQKLLAAKTNIIQRRRFGRNLGEDDHKDEDIEEESPDVEVRAVYEEVIDGLAAHLSEEKLQFVLDDDEVVGVEADCIVKARCDHKEKISPAHCQSLLHAPSCIKRS